MTIPWIATAPRVPHDIISGVQTELKGVELGFVPQAQGGGADFTTIDSVTLESVTTCGTDAQQFFLNGVAVGTLNINNVHCQCDPPITTTTVRAANVLAAWNRDLQANTGRFLKSTTTSHYLWAAMTVTQNGESKRLCIIDRTGGNCTESNLCAANTNAAIDQSRNNAWGDAAGAEQLSYVGTRFKWSYGDGQETAFQAITNPRILEARHTYNGPPGSPFTARLTICDNGNNCATADYPMVIRENSLETRVNVAIDRGLWYLHKQSQASGQILAEGSYGNLPSATAAAINAFEAHGHRETIDPRRSPYADTVKRALRYLWTRVEVVQIAGKNAGNPDVNGNGIGVTIAGRSNEVYQNGVIMDGIVASGTPDAVVPTGPLAELRMNGQPYTYGDAIQDMIDGYAWGQIDSNFALPQRGSWNYNYTPGHPDNSSSQWAAIGMIPAEREWGLTIPNFVKTENDAAVRSMWNADGTIGYASTGCIWGCAATTPSGMVQWIMDGRRSNNADFARSLTWIADNWGGGPNEGNTSLLLGYVYGMFAGFKAMRLANPPIERLTRSNGTSFDWYNDPALGVAHVLTSRQDANTGRFSGPGQTDIGGLYTQWSLLMLASSLFAQAPKAVAQAAPAQVALNQEVTFDHSGSFHLNPDIPIALFEWDFDGDGAFDFQTANINERPVHRFNPPLAQLPRVYTA
ncbi:MAG: hypothetical protein R3F60_27840, partial [bacterium]